MLPGKRQIVGSIGALAVTVTLTACGGNGAPYPAAPSGVNNNKVAVDDDVKATGQIVTQVVAKKAPRIGNVVTDSKGWIFYRFDNDSAKPSESTCLESCTDSWPPVLVKSDKNLPALKGVDEGEVDAIKRDDGRWQLTIGGWPMYRFAGDTKAGQWEGQGNNGSWFVATKDGKKNLSLLPDVGGAGAEDAAGDPADEGGGDTADDSGEDTGDGGSSGGGGY